MTVFLGEKIKNLRHKKNLSQVSLSNKMLSRPTLSKIETNKILPSLEQLMYLADELEVPISYFFSAKDINSHDCDIFNSIDELYQNKRYFDIINLYEDKHNNDQIICYYFLGMSYFNIDVFDFASKYLKKFISLYKVEDEIIKSTYVEHISIALNTLSKILMRNKNYNKCLKYLFIADNYLKSYNSTHKKIYFIICNNIASIYCILCRYADSKNFLENFFMNNIDLYYISIISDMYLSLNISCFNLSEYEKAISYIKKSIFFYNLTDRNYDELESYFNYVNSLRYLYKFENAIALIDMVTLKAESFPEIIEMFKIQKFIIYYNSKNIKKLVEYYHCENLNLKLLRKKSLMDYYFICGCVEYYKSDYKKCHNYFLKCEQYLIKKDRFLDLSIIYDIFATILEAEEYTMKSMYYKNLFNSSNSSLSVNITLPD